MEAQPIYTNPVYACKRACICKTCDSDNGGVCKVGRGDCESAQRYERCPVGECEAWRLKVDTENLQITEYTIADRIRELREAFREEYGLEVRVMVHAYDGTKNPHLTRETAEKLGTEIAGVFPGQHETAHGDGETAKWFRVDTTQEDRTAIVLFYKEGPA